ncbi:MAG: outer membrane beta-barrel protein [Burkholderiales bacterium]
MKKLLIASAVSAAFAVPTAVIAQTAPAAPTLDKVLEASGISLSGYIDTAYSRANRNIEAGIGTPPVAPRVFDDQNNSFALHQVGLTVAKQPKEGFGGLVNVTGGKDAQVINSVGAATSQVDVTQAYGQYATGPLTVIAGKYTTMHGTEVIASTGNTNFSRSILFGAVPFTHTGVRGTYAVSDSVSLMAGVNNGWDQLSDANKGKTLELGATLTPIKPLSIVLSAMSGSEPVGTTNGTRTSLNAVGTYTLTDAISFGAEYLSVSQENFTSLVDGSAITAKYNGIAGYFTYMLTPKWRGVLRVESFTDTDGFHFGTVDTKYKEATATISYLASDSYELRGEARSDSADKAVFTDTGGTASKSLLTFAVQGIYKF